MKQILQIILKLVVTLYQFLWWMAYIPRKSLKKKNLKALSNLESIKLFFELKKKKLKKQNKMV